MEIATLPPDLAALVGGAVWQQVTLGESGAQVYRLSARVKVDLGEGEGATLFVVSQQDTRQAELLAIAGLLPQAFVLPESRACWGFAVYPQVQADRL